MTNPIIGYFGKYRGYVTDNDDPNQLGRLKARVALLSGVETGWALPAAAYAGDGVGLFAIPPTGSGVWIEFEAGQLERPVWSGCWWGDGQLPEGPTPKITRLRTPAGHSVTLDDSGGGEQVKIADKFGATIVMKSSGIEITKGSQKIVLTQMSVNVNDGALEVM